MASGDAAVDDVLSASTRRSASTFSADYDLLTRFGDLRTHGHGRPGRLGRGDR